VRATLKGNILVALIQGLLGGLAFWVLGITGAVLWGALMAVLSLMPAVGAALVWGPVAVHLLGPRSLRRAGRLTRVRRRGGGAGRRAGWRCGGCWWWGWWTTCCAPSWWARTSACPTTWCSSPPSAGSRCSASTASCSAR